MNESSYVKKLKTILRSLGLSSLLWKLKAIFDHVFGSICEEMLWKSLSSRWARETLSEASLAQPVRTFILEQIEDKISPSSILEVGCAAGANLYLLSKVYPEVEMHGVDINKRAIAVGQAFFADRSVKKVTLTTCSVQTLGKSLIQQYDLGFTHAVFLHIGPDRVRQALKEFFNACTGKLMFIELHDANVELCRYDSRWIYNWHTLLADFPECSYSLEKTPSWMAGEPWLSDGYVIWVDLLLSSADNTP